MIGISAFKWQLFISYLSSKVKLSKLFALYLSGYFVNLLFPSYIGGDALRSYYVGKKVGQHQALSATMLERYTGLLAMATLGLIAALYEDQILTIGIRLTVMGFGLAVIVATFCATFFRINPDSFRNRWLKKIALKLDELHEIILKTSKSPSLWLKAMAISFFYHFLTVANTYVAARAVGWEEPPVLQLFVVLPIILVLGSLPITPSGLGIQEGAFLHFLQILGASSPQALGVGILLRAKTYFLALLGWAVWSYMGAGAAIRGKEKGLTA
jgi:uncharacterized protein (TIRG00374 family)